MKQNNDYEIIDGKPHLGLFFGNCSIVNHAAFCGKKEENPLFCMAKQRLQRSMYDHANYYADLQIRYDEWIIRPPCYGNPLDILGTIGLKYMIWGRAFKVMRLVKKGGRRYKKVFINNKRRVKRVQ